jgi:hypothetical protein
VARVSAVILLAALSVSSCGGDSPSMSARPTAVPIQPTGPPAIPGVPGQLPVADGQSVVWAHCGVLPIRFDGEQWKVRGGPLNAPSTFSGFGDLERRGSELRFTDDKGLELTFVPWDGQPDPQSCA